MLHMGDQHNNNPKVNIAYFVGTNRTRFLQIKLRYLRGLMVGALLLIGWAIVSGLIIYSFWGDISRLNVALQESRTTIFAFQSRYDGIYEEAYNDAVKSLPAKVVESDKPVVDQRPTSKVVSAEPEPKPMPLPVRKILPIPERLTTSKGWQVALQRPLFNVAGNEFSLQFRIVNTTKTGKRLSGHVWAQAKVRTAGGQQLTLIAPRELLIDNNGNPRNLGEARPYRIRRRKLEKLTFNLPKGEAGEIEELTVVMRDRANNRASYTFPLGVKFVTIPPNISISKKVIKESL